jgi:hypothetical protein
MRLQAESADLEAQIAHRENHATNATVYTLTAKTYRGLAVSYERMANDDDANRNEQ